MEKVINIKAKRMKYTIKNKRKLLYAALYRGYKFYILNLGTHPTAYIEIPKKDKLYGIGYEHIDIDVHGGLTYADSNLIIEENKILKDSWFIGWDYAHAGDYSPLYDELLSCVDLDKFKEAKKWTTKEIIDECIDAINQIINYDLEYQREIEKKGYKNILKDFVENENTQYCYDWQGFNSDIIIPCIEKSLKENKELNQRINQALEYIENAEGNDIEYIGTLLRGCPKSWEIMEQKLLKELQKANQAFKEELEKEVDNNES